MGLRERLKMLIEELEFTLLLIALLPLSPLIEDEDYVPEGIDYDPGEWE